MAKKVRIPTPLRKLTNNEELVGVNGVVAAWQTGFSGVKLPA
jgi:hypothetical protein